MEHFYKPPFPRRSLTPALQRKQFSERAAVSKCKKNRINACDIHSELCEYTRKITWMEKKNQHIE
jgi:hypothetical protein